MGPGQEESVGVSVKFTGRMEFWIRVWGRFMGSTISRVQVY